MSAAVVPCHPSLPSPSPSPSPLDTHSHTHFTALNGGAWHRFCAELVAATLQVGGLLSSCSNPGAATPYSLWKLYKDQAAAAANPFTLRNQFQHTFHHPVPNGTSTQMRASAASAANVSQQQQQQQLCTPTAATGGAPQRSRVGVASQRRVGSPPRAALRALSPAVSSASTSASSPSARPGHSSQRSTSSTPATTGTLALSMRSLTMGRK